MGVEDWFETGSWLLRVEQANEDKTKRKEVRRAEGKNVKSDMKSGTAEPQQVSWTDSQTDG